MKISILNPAPAGRTMQKWGDYHFGVALQRALEARGVNVVQHFWPHWGEQESAGADAVIVLRGKRYIRPPADGRPWLLWVISHPAAVSRQELDAYTVACVASATMWKMIEGGVETPVRVLRQCTDPALFVAPRVSLEEDAAGRDGLLFVANSRGVHRSMVIWGASTGMRADVIGQGWRELGFGDLVVSNYLANEKLPELYRSYRLGLNDQWADMQFFGIISNRVFDCLASGLPVLSEPFPELKEVFGDDLLYASDEREYWDATWRGRLHYPELLQRTRDVWARIGSSFTFDARAEELIDALNRPRGERAVYASSRPLDVESCWLEVAAMMSAAAREGALRVLHVQPSGELSAALVRTDGIEWLGAGVGEGPWEVTLDLQDWRLPEHWFDSVILDGGISGAGSDSLAIGRLVCKLAGAVKSSGMLLVIRRPSAMADAAPWERALKHLPVWRRRNDGRSYRTYVRAGLSSGGNDAE